MKQEEEMQRWFKSKLSTPDPSGKIAILEGDDHQNRVVAYAETEEAADLIVRAVNALQEAETFHSKTGVDDPHHEWNA